MNQDDLSAEVMLRDGRAATVRPLRSDDIDQLGAFFADLSAETRSRYGPHPFDRATAERLCNTIDQTKTMRFVTILDDAPTCTRIIGYMILTRVIGQDDRDRYGDRINPDECAAFAPAVADAYQDQGVGSQMARHVLGPPASR